SVVPFICLVFECSSCSISIVVACVACSRVAILQMKSLWLCRVHKGRHPWNEVPDSVVRCSSY
ncbi:hypothetical protein L9F63_009973, partial [Diploptera punctata]